VDISERKMLNSHFGKRRTSETASQAKSEFLANMSTRFETPMNGVLGMIELCSTRNDRQQKGPVADAKDSARSLLLLLNDILDLSR